MIVIIGAMDEEIKCYNKYIKNGKWNGIPCDIVKSGIGKVAACYTTTTMIIKHRTNIKAIINTGSAGGIYEKYPVGHTIISSGFIHHDVDVTGLGYELGQLPDLPTIFKTPQHLIDLFSEETIGLIGSGDQFCNGKERIDFIKENFPNILAVEMEGAAIAQICNMHNIPMIGIRTISDIAGQENNTNVSFKENLKIASEKCSNLISKCIGLI